MNKKKRQVEACRFFLVIETSRPNHAEGVYIIDA